MNKYLKDIFIHLDGIAMSPLYEMLDPNNNNNFGSDILDGFFCTENTLKDNTHLLNDGYCSIIAKILQGQNILKFKKNRLESNSYYDLTDYGTKILNKRFSYSGFKNYYKCSIDLINGDISLNDKNFQRSFSKVHSTYAELLKYNDKNSILCKHIEGSIIAPIIVFYNFTHSNKVIKVNDLSDEIVAFLKSIKFIDKKDLTEKGQYLLSKAYAYGVTESYMKTFIYLEDLCLNKIKGIAHKKDHNNNEYHVNRSLNVWGSGHSHATYFKYIDNYVIDIFNKPIEKQPIGVADMGCGDGALLYHLNELIKNKTLRGSHLDTHPLHLIGADFNQAALDETIKMFSNKPNQPMTVLADISKPDEYAQKVKTVYSLDISDFLNVRSFLDHNRRYSTKSASTELDNYTFASKTNNAFCWKGIKINSQEIQNNLVRHFKKWEKYISKYGLLALELHSIKIEDVFKNIGKAPMTAYIATHGLSDQFIIEYDVYTECISKAGLSISKNYEKTFPNSDIEMISINLIS